MKRVFRKNQIVITTLAIMIAVAGYLNYSGKILQETADTAGTEDSTILLKEEGNDLAYYQEYTDIVSLDGDGTQEVSASQEQTAVVGEAVLASTTAGTDILAAAKLNREQVRAKNKETLLEIINNTNIANEQKQEAVDTMNKMTVTAEKEAAAELLLEAKGFADAIVTMTDGSVDVVVNETELNDAQRAQIEDIVKRKTEVSGDKIVITASAGANASGVLPK